jgi:hypothetical protein
MDIKEKRKQYYLNYKDKLLTYSKQYNYDNRDERQKYNYEYWSINGHKYIYKGKETQLKYQNCSKYCFLF